MSTISESAERTHAVRSAVNEVARRTPLVAMSQADQPAGHILLKAESLQLTGSYKIRGALAKLHALGDEARAGVVCGSAGNHAQGVAAAARARGVPCDVIMPRSAPITKIEGAERLGANVVLTGDSVEECLIAALEKATTEGKSFIHPFDDLDVIAGQGTVGLEILEDVPDLAKVIVPVGGGGLAAGAGAAIKAQRPDVEIVGVQAHAFPAARLRFLGHSDGALDTVRIATVADGIAVTRPGTQTVPLLRQVLKSIELVSEDAVADAMVALLEHYKLVVEGAGAVGVAALHAGIVTPADTGTTIVIVTGGNVDIGVLASIARRHETGAGRRIALRTTLTDRPGALARLLTAIADEGANVVAVEHVREGIQLRLDESAVQLVLETRSGHHAEQVVAAIGGFGSDTRVVA